MFIQHFLGWKGKKATCPAIRSFMMLYWGYKRCFLEMKRGKRWERRMINCFKHALGDTWKSSIHKDPPKLISPEITKLYSHHRLAKMQKISKNAPNLWESVDKSQTPWTRKLHIQSSKLLILLGSRHTILLQYTQVFGRGQSQPSLFQVLDKFGRHEKKKTRNCGNLNHVWSTFWMSKYV